MFHWISESSNTNLSYFETLKTGENSRCCICKRGTKNPILPVHFICRKFLSQCTPSPCVTLDPILSIYYLSQKFKILNNCTSLYAHYSAFHWLHWGRTRVHSFFKRVPLVIPVHEFGTHNQFLKSCPEMGSRCQFSAVWLTTVEEWGVSETSTLVR